MNIVKFLRTVFLYNTSGGCFWQSYQGTAKPAGVTVLWFRSSTCSILIKNVHKMLLKQFFTITWQIKLFGAWLLVTCFWFQNMLLKNINCFRFWWKTYAKRCTSNYVISRVKWRSFPALFGWSGVFNFRVWFGKRNMTVKIPILILFLFYLLCWLINHLFCVLSVVAPSCFNYIDTCRWS